MLAKDFVKILSGALKTISTSGIKVEDYKHVALCDEYMEMAGKGLKKEYIIAVLSKRHKLSRSTLYRILNRLLRDVRT